MVLQRFVIYLPRAILAASLTQKYLTFERILPAISSLYYFSKNTSHGRDIIAKPFRYHPYPMYLKRFLNDTNITIGTRSQSDTHKNPARPIFMPNLPPY